MPHAHPELDALRDPARLAADAALPAQEGHFDELREADGRLRPHWHEFFDHLGSAGFADLERRRAIIERRIRDDGITYNVYSDEGVAPRPWSLDLLPFIVSATDWTQLERGIVQRAALMAAIMQDVYGAQRLLADGLLPAALVLGSPGYLRPLAGYAPAGDLFLHILAFDLARDADGTWWVVSQRTQTPSGLGYALQNRMVMRSIFPEAFRDMRVQHLASSYRSLLDTVLRLAPRAADRDPRVALLTPGPYNETYFEHAYLARYLGIPLVEGGDLTVREDRVFMKALYGLRPVDALLRRLEDVMCDPLELRPESQVGVPALLQAIRARNVLVANAPGSGFLESPALNGFLPAIAQRLLGAPMILPSLASWWCGERAAYAQVKEQLTTKVIKPTFPHTAYRPAFEAVIGADLDREQLASLRRHMAEDPDAYTAQDYLPLSQAPTWREGVLAPHAAMIRVFAISDGAGGWKAMPGGLTRLAVRDMHVVSMQRGGSSADTWVLTDGVVDSFTMVPQPKRPQEIAAERRIVTSRAAENMFWMGRYAERSEFGVRLARAILSRLDDEENEDPALLDAISDLAAHNGLLPSGVAVTDDPAIKTLSIFQRVLQAAATAADGVSGIEHNLVQLTRAASRVRERLSADHWRLLVETSGELREDSERVRAGGQYSTDEVLGVLARFAVRLTAITGAQTDQMTRDDGWRLLAIGRHVERSGNLARALRVMLGTGALAHEQGVELALALFDSTITYRSMHQNRLEMPLLIDLLVLNTDNPRALAGVFRRLLREMARLPADALPELLPLVPGPDTWPSLAALCATDGDARHAMLQALLDRICTSTHTLADAIGERFFTHAAEELRLLNF